MKVGDIMTRQVISVPPDTPALAVARLLAERGVSAVPVTDASGMLLSIVSEADLIRRLATGAAPEVEPDAAAVLQPRPGGSGLYPRAWRDRRGHRDPEAGDGDRRP
ncbi:CBS domain-containing protein [Siccirubricoccus sp. G192]|uniref:CBS domain-containing protein n=1 Tax=Siccirubricoccus sp. G192 TaxID=2849651 RepID=UPI001C2CBB41|nr:CBS domain-containing protein [Siccirubricoccus sp. G192]MBV1795574.1 CBS domain-containing protein [Siccirubricoccus sp. G192]